MPKKLKRIGDNYELDGVKFLCASFVYKRLGRIPDEVEIEISDKPPGFKIIRKAELIYEFDFRSNVSFPAFENYITNYVRRKEIYVRLTCVS